MGVLVSIYCSNYSTKQQVSTTVYLINVFLIAFGQQRRSIEQMYQALETQRFGLFVLFLDNRKAHRLRSFI